jgi:hypothetical protein
MMTVYEIVSILNMILPLIAVIGYLLRLKTSIKYKDFSYNYAVLVLYAIASFSIFLIYFLNLTGLADKVEPDYETYSRLYIRPFFTYLGTMFIISAWTHPDLSPTVERFKEGLWTRLLRLLGKK